MIRKFYQEHGTQFIKFIFVGGLNTFVGYAVFIFCIHFFDIHYAISLTFAYIAGIINSYIWNKKWTFQINTFSVRELMRFVFVYVVSYLFNYILLYIFIDHLDIPAAISQVFALGIVTPLVFFGQKLWAFAAKQEKYLPVEEEVTM